MLHRTLHGVVSQEEERRERATPVAPEPVFTAQVEVGPPRGDISPATVMGVQRTVGNHAVAALITRESGGGRLLQRATASGSYSIDQGAPTTVAGESVGMQGQGGVSHSEQRLWANIARRSRTPSRAATT